jgi:hypothetical protein
VSLADELTPAESVRREKPSHPAGWEPGVTWTGRSGTVTTLPIEGKPDWSSVLAAFDLDPATVEVIEPVQFRTWDAAVGNGEVRRMRYWRANVRSKRTGSANVDDLLALVKRRRPVAGRSQSTSSSANVTERSHWLSINDLQLGKKGTPAAVDRIVAGIEASAAHVRAERKAGRGCSTIYLPGVGDLLEGCGQHYAMQPYEVELDSREQRRLARRLVLYAIDEHRELAERLVLPVVGGNHGENNRVDGKSTTTFGDNSDVEVYEGVAEATAMNPAAYGHVSFLIPGQDLTLTVQPIEGGPIIGLAHGHQATRGATPIQKMWTWWGGQAMGQRPIGDADILLHGHWHQLIVHRDGSRLLMGGPTVDSGSQWFAETSGKESVPGMLSFTLTRHGVSSWAVL